MFGQNPIAPIVNKSDGKILHVVKGSPFATIQGEGPYAGHPSTFIRLHGCNLRCTFCDTQFSDPGDPLFLVEALVKECQFNGHQLVVITGGEPLRQNILPLCVELFNMGHIIQIETAGTLWIDGIQNFAKIVVSPKTPSIHPKALQHAAAFKYVISKDDDHSGYIPITATQPGTAPVRLAAPRKGAPVYLSPCDEYNETTNTKNRRLVADLALSHNAIAGLQMHKYFGVD
jgi:organic radical activating enzyme